MFYYNQKPEPCLKEERAIMELRFNWWDDNENWLVNYRISCSAFSGKDKPAFDRIDIVDGNAKPQVRNDLHSFKQPLIQAS